MALAIVGPILGLATWALVVGFRPSAPTPPPLRPAGTAPRLRAAAACHDLAAVQHLVATDADRDSVLAYLAAAHQELAIAAAAEPLWLSLQSGVASLDRGLRHDDAAASELGIAIARDQCRRAGVYLAGSVR